MIPEHTKQAIERYVEQHLQPGSFLEAVLCNDLAKACACADHMNSYALFDIVSYLYNNAPMSCWGSRENYEEWLRND